MNPQSSNSNDRPARSAPVHGAEQRVSILIGDRLCAACGYNLTGQPVLREAHYQMLIVRCPECATVASVQEYPLLGRWANRWAAFLAGLWLLLLLAMWIGSGAAFFGLSVGAAEIAAEKHRTFLNEQFGQWQLTNSKPTTAPAGGFVYNPAEFRAWWTPETRRAVLRDAGGFFRAIEPAAFWIWLAIAVVALCLGMFWSVALMNRRGLGLVGWAVAIMLVAAAFSCIPLIGWMQQEPGWTYNAAFQQIAPLMMLLTLAYTAVVLTIAMLIGRRVARWLVRTLLPPRLCQSLALLWTCDGLNPPRMK